MTRFVVHHVGARFGSTPFEVPARFASGIDLVLFDADEDCVDGLLEQGGPGGERRRIVAACLADADGEVEFRLTVNASASSLLEPSEASRGFVQPIFGIDWDVARCATVIERRRIHACRLDTLLAARPDIPPPDFLSLDTQGSESAIIAGASEAIRTNVIGLIVEVEFIDLYERVPRFGVIAGQLEEAGFHFAGFRHMIDAQASRQPIGRRSDGFPVAADALFLRRIDCTSGPECAGSLLRLAFASVVFGFLDHAFAALDAAAAPALEPAQPDWLAFLARLQQIALAEPRLFLPRFPDILPAHEIRRFAREPDITRWPGMMDTRAWQSEQELRDGSVHDTLDRLELVGDTPIEAHLRDHGFAELADRTNLCRRDQAHKLRRFLSGSM